MGQRDIALLSTRERAVLRLVQRGLQTDEIARELDRSPNTIENQIASARRKLGGVTRRQAARLLDEAEPETSRGVDHGGSSTSRPFTIPDSRADRDQSASQFETVREERAVFLTDPFPAPLDRHPTAQQGPRHQQLTTVMMIVATTIGILIILAATPSLVESFKAFTAWLIQTFY